jgi:chemotaxis methyl-accepting protein methylase
MSKQNKDLILLILDIQGIEDRLREFERKYRLRSGEFYRLVQEGKIEQRLELIEWLGLYETLLAREAEYQQLLERQVEPVLAALNSTPIPA